MEVSSDRWTEVEAAYRAGMSVTGIREQFEVSIAELIRRIRDGGWRRASEDRDVSEPGGDSKEPEYLPALVDDVAKEAIRDTAADIVEAHRSITQRLRERFETELAEFDASCRFFGSFRDEAHVAQLATKKDGGSELRRYLTQCLAHHKQRAEMLEKLSRIGGNIVNVERLVWALDSKDEDPEDRGFEDLLEELQKPLDPQSLPDNVLEFDRRITRGREG